MNSETLLKTDFKDLKLYKRGKVRDVYDIGDKLLVISTDRISALMLSWAAVYPSKEGANGLSSFWFDFIKGITPHHFIASDISQYPKELQKYKSQLAGRSMLVVKTKPLPVECVVRVIFPVRGGRSIRKSNRYAGYGCLPGCGSRINYPRLSLPLPQRQMSDTT